MQWLSFSHILTQTHAHTYTIYTQSLGTKGMDELDTVGSNYWIIQTLDANQRKDSRPRLGEILQPRGKEVSDNEQSLS